MVYEKQVIMNRAAVNLRKNSDEARNSQVLGGVLIVSMPHHS